MQITANGITLEVEEHGARSGEPLVLIMGLGMQLVAWPDGFVQLLVERGFRVIRFDNRDVGLSQSFDHLGAPKLAWAVVRHTLGWRVQSPYTLGDMADDTAALLGALAIPRAHVCGASLGGMVAQHLALRHPARVASLTLMMTSSGARGLPGPSLSVQRLLLSRPDKRDLEQVIAHQVRVFRCIGSPAHPTGEGELRKRLGLAVRRSFRPAASARQLLAVAADRDRAALLGGIAVPTRVLHGTADPLVPMAAGADLARRIPGAVLELVEGMGHDLPEALWPRFVSAICAAAGRT
jgi:pimeloyl-ACP methyl ester carboxylesterase